MAGGEDLMTTRIIVCGALMDYETGTYIRCATEDETQDSIERARRDGGAGVIRVGDRRCYVEGGKLGRTVAP